ncbi:YihY/virulence factor BrkB family protein [Spirilliplanes yamanashiensis]|uniref:Uncharacterized protein n=1 Tax=Spirilliplanes yamanashiensis TaxID=42233 RepID=A0A8J4DFP7_9ACTN|nr:YihY/virulence factor BrkB family protein [Spirilliplanes yamanashiensis]MDP9814196.1 membrane protein [Spirilliplanes yamanashiensis]GIJ00822.1 hypothetical protein Sya03_01740 [Spirilliplanes yamanashiensis]
MTNPLDRLEAGALRLIRAGRRRSRVFDHFCCAYLRYDSVLGGRLAAAIAYYGFFAVFALILIAYWIFGQVLRGNDALDNLVGEFLQANLPFVDTNAIQASGRTVGIVGLLGLTFTGIGWIEAIRSSQRHIWQLDQQPGDFLVRFAVDLLVMIGVLLLVFVSFGAAYALESLIGWLSGDRVPFVLDAVSWVLTVLVNMLLAAALLMAVPRLRMTVRRLAPSVIMVGVGITLLNTVGRFFVGIIQRNPAYGLVVSAVGLLVYLYVFNQLLLFGAAWAATSPHGYVSDYSGDRMIPPMLPEPSKGGRDPESPVPDD